ncbi:hypothetical protein BTR23_06740 [Alkalihalophilus pseudofirmus]|uniref:hypothetical protein n=1 Tax=Alkalihalobacterium alkalinitrilicum TaxID=427920 RepID=UPI00094CEED4|nr:hypothetical protein [Alkalihalobacterium alkalinitrilicum]OLO40190.1 hypothetical protein BTR23_06740 [Alkalihalophilus pseudofirmus]
MVHKKLFFLLFSSLFIFGGSSVFAHAEDYYNELYWKSQSIEKQYEIMGYQTKSAAVKQFEQLYQKRVNLPIKMPPIEITHSFGIIDSYSYPPKLEIEYVNENQPKEQIKMFIIPVEQGIYNKAQIAQTFILGDGGKAIQLRDRYHNILIFHKGDWEYILANSKRIEDKVSIQDLINMANSIN